MDSHRTNIPSILSIALSAMDRTAFWRRSMAPLMSIPTANPCWQSYRKLSRYRKVME